jgi:hypothetical protein
MPPFGNLPVLIFPIRHESGFSVMTIPCKLAGLGEIESMSLNELVLSFPVTALIPVHVSVSYLPVLVRC